MVLTAFLMKPALGAGSTPFPARRSGPQGCSLPVTAVVDSGNADQPDVTMDARRSVARARSGCRAESRSDDPLRAPRRLDRDQRSRTPSRWRPASGSLRSLRYCTLLTFGQSGFAIVSPDRPLPGFFARVTTAAYVHL